MSTSQVHLCCLYLAQLSIVSPVLGFCNCSMFCCALLYVHSSLYNDLDWEERAGCFAKFVFLVSRDCCVALNRGAVGMSAVRRLAALIDSK